MFSSLHSCWSGKNSLAGDSSERQLQNRYTPGLTGKSGWSAMPSRPRSDALFTAKSSSGLRLQDAIEDTSHAARVFLQDEQIVGPHERQTRRGFEPRRGDTQ